MLATIALTTSATLASTSVGQTVINLGRGPVVVHVPPSIVPAVPAPLVMLLHGYGGTGASIEADVQLMPLSDSFGFLYIHPDGTSDLLGNQFWNATDACCDIFNSGVDDSTYLRSLIEAIQTMFNVDPRRIHVFGASNGGFMTHRMACDHADLIASVVSFAGATFDNPLLCNPSNPVHVLQVHGTADTTIFYAGGALPGGVYPGAVATVEQWATLAGCSLVPDTSLPPLDLEATIPGAETIVARYADGCDSGGSAELWTIVGGGHIPTPTPQFAPLLVEYLFAHPKPALCSSDFTPPGGDSVVNIQELLAVLGAWGSCVGCNADLNNDGLVNVNDLLAVLGDWGACS